MSREAELCIRRPTCPSNSALKHTGQVGRSFLACNRGDRAMRLHRFLRPLNPDRSSSRMNLSRISPVISSTVWISAASSPSDFEHVSQRGCRRAAARRCKRLEFQPVSNRAPCVLRRWRRQNNAHCSSCLFLALSRITTRRLCVVFERPSATRSSVASPS
jgi:hypothetical protein